MPRWLVFWTLCVQGIQHSIRCQVSLLIVDSYSERCWALITPPKTAPHQQSPPSLLQSPHSKLPHPGKVYCLPLPHYSIHSGSPGRGLQVSSLQPAPSRRLSCSTSLWAELPRNFQFSRSVPCHHSCCSRNRVMGFLFGFQPPRRAIPFPIGYSLCPTVATRASGLGEGKHLIGTAESPNSSHGWEKSAAAALSSRDLFLIGAS